MTQGNQRWAGQAARGRRLNESELNELQGLFDVEKRGVRHGFTSARRGYKQLKPAQGPGYEVGHFTGKHPIVAGSVLGAAGGGGATVVHGTRRRTDTGVKRVSKRERYYDPEAARQRRMGAASSALLLGGGALGAQAYKEGAAQTKTVRGKKIAGMSPKLVALNPRTAGKAGGSLVLLEGGRRVFTRGTHRKNREWN